MKKFYVILFTLLIITVSFGQVINEFEPNPVGTDPTNVSFELKGTPSAAFSGWILTLENDGANGLVDRAASVSGTFDANGLLVVTVPDLENPSFTIVLVSDFTGTAGTTDVDTNDDGVADDISTFGTVYDAIGIPDATADETNLYGAGLGGSDFVYSGDEPRLVFRDGVTGDLYAVNDAGGVLTDDTIFNIGGVEVQSTDFDIDPSAANTFGSVNPVYTAPTEPSLTINSPEEAAILAPTASTSMDVTFTVQNFNVASSGSGDGHIHYKVDNGNIVMKFDTDPITLTGLSTGAHSVYMELVDDNHTPISPAVNTTVNFTIASISQVSTITGLRAGVEGDYYELLGEAIVTYTRTNRNQKYIEDASAPLRGTSKTASGSGILIDDSAGAITTTFNIGDGISGLKGRLSSFSGVLQFVPLEDPGAASSTGNTITPEVVTESVLATNWENYESELVEIKSATFVGATGNFVASTDYTINDGTSDLIFRTNFSEADYIGTPIPTTPQNLVVLVGEFNGTPQVIARSLTDLTLRVGRNAIEGFSLFPNPVTNGRLTINTLSNADKKIQIFDILGKQVLSTNLKGRELNVSKLNSGIYILKILEEGKTATRKLVIK